MSEELELEALKDGEQVIGTLEGWRAWDLETEAPCLLSLNGKVWLPRQVKVAKCQSSPHHKAPRRDCHCGIYAVRTFADLDRRVPDAVFGRVSLWGRVVIHEQGMRGQYAYPNELYVRKSLAHYAPALAELYGVEVKVAGERVQEERTGNDKTTNHSGISRAVAFASFWTTLFFLGLTVMLVIAAGTENDPDRWSVPLMAGVTTAGIFFFSTQWIPPFMRWLRNTRKRIKAA